MDFSPTQEQQMALDSFRRFAESEIQPALEAYEDSFVPEERATVTAVAMVILPLEA